MKSPELHSDRLMLRNWEVSEAHKFVELTKDQKLIFGTMPFPYLLEHAEFWVREVLEHEDKHYFAIHDKNIDDIVGFCWITFCLHKNEGLIAYGLSEAARGKGFATEAAKLMADFAFNNLKLDRLVAETVGDNIGSHNVLVKLGFEVIDKVEGGSKERVTGKVKDKWFWELKKDFHFDF